MKNIILIIIAVMLICIPLFAQEEDAGSSAAADAGAAAGCEKLNLGSWEGMEAEEETTTAEGETVTNEEYLRDMELYEQSKQEGQKTDELLCEENPNPDGTLTCYEGDRVLTCQVQGEQILCPE